MLTVVPMPPGGMTSTIILEDMALLGTYSADVVVLVRKNANANRVTRFAFLTIRCRHE